MASTRRDVLRGVAAAGVAVGGLTTTAGSATAAVGDELGVVDLPGNVESAYPWEYNCALGSAFDGTYFATLFDGTERPPADRRCVSDTLQWYEPPAGGDGAATLAGEKRVVDGDGEPVPITAISWDATRGQYWAAGDGDVWLVDAGDPTADGEVAADLAFGGLPERGERVTGLAYDRCTDTVWYAAETDAVYQYDPDGTEVATITPDPDGFANRYVSGVAPGPAVEGQPTLYVACNGFEQIAQVDAADGSGHADVVDRVARQSEGLAYDPATYAPTAAVLIKNVHYDGTYTAFAVDAGNDGKAAAVRDPRARCGSANGAGADGRSR